MIQKQCWNRNVLLTKILSDVYDTLKKLLNDIQGVSAQKDNKQFGRTNYKRGEFQCAATI